MTDFYDRNPSALLHHVSTLTASNAALQAKLCKQRVLVAIAREELSAAQARIAEMEANDRRYRVLRRSVLTAPLSASMSMITTEADIDAQCDQLAPPSPPGEQP